MINLLYIFLAIALYKFVNNFVKYRQCKQLYDKYITWLVKDNKMVLSEHKTQVIKLFKDAGIEDAPIPFAQPVGYGNIVTGNASSFDNFPSRREDVAHNTVDMFDQSIGVYRMRMWETINPLYWIDAIIYLPRTVLSYLGVSSDNIGAKLLQVMYWAGGVALIWYRPDLKKFVEELVKQVFP